MAALMPGDASFLADAIADELRNKLRELARQVADLQVATTAKDMRIRQLLEQKAIVERKLGMAVGDRQAGEWRMHSCMQRKLTSAYWSPQQMTRADHHDSITIQMLPPLMYTWFSMLTC